MVDLLNNSFVNLQTLSSFWTHENIASEAMVLTNTIDNEAIQLDNIRHHVNANIAHLANLLNLAMSPWYGVWFEFSLENGLHRSGLEWCDLSGSNGLFGYNVYPLMHSIRRINVIAEQGAPADAWVGNCTKLDIAQLTELMSLKNIQYRQSICWTHNGSELLIFTGGQVLTPNHPERSTFKAMTLTDTHFVGWGYRKPRLDALVPESVVTGQTWTDPARGVLTQNYKSYIDLPDEHSLLLIKMTQKSILEQLREQIPQQLEAEVNAGLAMIGQNLQMDIDLEKKEREKRKYGDQQRSPGAM